MMQVRCLFSKRKTPYNFREDWDSNLQYLKSTTMESTAETHWRFRAGVSRGQGHTDFLSPSSSLSSDWFKKAPPKGSLLLVRQSCIQPWAKHEIIKKQSTRCEERLQKSIYRRWHNGTPYLAWVPNTDKTDSCICTHETEKVGLNDHKSRRKHETSGWALECFTRKSEIKSNKGENESWEPSNGEVGKNNDLHKTRSCAYHTLLYCLKFNSSIYSRDEKQDYIEHSRSEKGAMMLLAKLSTDLPAEHAQRRKHNPGVRTSGTIWIPDLSLNNWLCHSGTKILLPPLL